MLHQRGSSLQIWKLHSSTIETDLQSDVKHHVLLTEAYRWYCTVLHCMINCTLHAASILFFCIPSVFTPNWLDTNVLSVALSCKL